MKKRTIYYYRKRKKIIELLGGKCVICGSSDKLEFDHINRNTKKYEISRMITYAYDVILEEIKKCQLLCNKCHVVKTLKELNKKPSKEQHGTLSAYVHAKCRCPSCKENWNKKTKEYKKK